MKKMKTNTNRGIVAWWTRWGLGIMLGTLVLGLAALISMEGGWLAKVFFLSLTAGAVVTAATGAVLGLRGKTAGPRSINKVDVAIGTGNVMAIIALTVTLLVHRGAEPMPMLIAAAAFQFLFFVSVTSVFGK